MKKERNEEGKKVFTGTFESGRELVRQQPKQDVRQYQQPVRQQPRQEMRHSPQPSHKNNVNVRSNPNVKMGR